MDMAGSTAMEDTRSPVHREAMTVQERDRLRRYIAVHVVGDDPPPLTAEAKDLIRAMLGSGHAGKSAAA
jgi:hypothetical protein